MVETAKSICSDINVVAIPPRFEPPHATGNIAALNANLVTWFRGMEITLRQSIIRTDDEFFHRACYKLSVTFGKTFFKQIYLFVSTVICR